MGLNEPAGVLAAWTALEALSPQTYRKPEDRAAGDKRCIVDLTRASDLPWFAGERSRPQRQLYYEIYLGAVRMDVATERLGQLFGLDDERATSVRERAALATLLVDKNGYLLPENAVAISSFGWALPLALRSGLGDLGAWPKLEHEYIQRLETLVRRLDREGKPLPVDLRIIQHAHAWLRQEFSLDAELVEEPSFAVRIYHYYKAKSPPEASLLNSFYLGDLARAQALLGRCALPSGLKQYLGVQRPTQTQDLLRNMEAVEGAVAPSLTPAARWPSPGGHPLVLLQQAAVNLSRHELRDSGMIAVNGPPGTGKTTLLRDIVAGAVIDRALAMTKFDDPQAAFSPSGLKVAAGPKGFHHLYKLDPTLRGHELIVASSNNKAVENISRELPAIHAVGRSTEELSYFRSISDWVLGRRQREYADPSPTETEEPLETWGLIAAVLGNARNRFAFTQDFWWHDDRGFRLYLKAAKGDDVVREIKDEASGKVIQRRLPQVVQMERPPSPQSSAKNWRQAKKRFLDLHAEVASQLADLERLRAICHQLVEAEQAKAKAEAKLPSFLSQTAAARAMEAETSQPLRAAEARLGHAQAAVAQHIAHRPGFLARLFRTHRAQQWSETRRALGDAMAAATQGHEVARERHDRAVAGLQAAERQLLQAQQQLDHILETARDFRTRVDDARITLGPRIVDATYFARGHREFHLEAPWIPDSLHRKREELFISALALHRAFIDCAAQRILHNLSVLIASLSSRTSADQDRRKLLGDLWSTLFLVVPVVSTTFASVEAMFGELDPGTLGWLLIDEAGQALPQAAVGAIMRAQRTIAVGDPFQIPPVVSLPERLSTEICRYFNVDSFAWAAPDASAQTLADLASKYQARFGEDDEGRSVGLPLLVHRRCQEPMFSISNRIAYDGLMVHAAGPRRAGQIGETLGPSRWLDIDADAASKWCPEEGELVVSLLWKLASAGIKKPDLFIITPFRLVAQGLRRRLEDERELFESFGVNAFEWTRDRVGTIHTVQGREADSVIMVLGAPAAANARARAWAAGAPNIFNVAVSRAQQNLYIVGSHAAWAGIGHGADLTDLPVEQAGRLGTTPLRKLGQ